MPWFATGRPRRVCSSRPPRTGRSGSAPPRRRLVPKRSRSWQGQLKIVWKQPLGEGHSSPVSPTAVYVHNKGQRAPRPKQSTPSMRRTANRLGKSYARDPYKGCSALAHGRRRRSPANGSTNYGSPGV